MTIHADHPFATPEDPVKRFRGRLGGAVSLWTAGAGDPLAPAPPGTGPAGLTVSSLMVANGDPGAVCALLDPDSDLADRLEDTGRGVVHLLDEPDRELADAFGGVAPAPGGPFKLARWMESPYGPVLADRTHALVSLATTQKVGWSVLVTATIDDLVLLEDREPLTHRRGRYGPR